MSNVKTPKTPATPKTTVLVRMPLDLLAHLDAEVRRRREASGEKVSRSSVLRDLVAQLKVG